MLYELQTALFGPYLGDPCPDCPGGFCDEPAVLTPTGDLLVSPSEADDVFISWPRCPRSFDPYYLAGYSLVPLDEALRFAWESGSVQVHRLTAGLSRLFRHWHVLSSGRGPHLVRMAEARAAAKADDDGV